MHLFVFTVHSAHSKRFAMHTKCTYSTFWRHVWTVFALHYYSRYQKVISRTTYVDTFHYLHDVHLNICLIAATIMRQSIHCWSLKNELALSLFVLRIFTDNSDCTFSFDYFALFTNWFYWWSNFHVKPSFHKKTVIHCNTQKTACQHDKRLFYHFFIGFFIYLSK